MPKQRFDIDFVNPRQVNEMTLVDEDIRAAFAGCVYMAGMPLMAQVSKDLRALSEILKAQSSTLPRRLELRDQTD